MASTDDAATNREFAKANNAGFPILSDPGGNTAKAYGVLTDSGYAARWTYYIDRDGKIAHVDKKVDPYNAGKGIVERLRIMDVPHK